jgi:hypothetical protein
MAWLKFLFELSECPSAASSVWKRSSMALGAGIQRWAKCAVTVQKTSGYANRQYALMHINNRY